jgi:uncharacterized membrane protein YccC
VIRFMPLPIPSHLQRAFEVRHDEASLLAGVACGIAVTLPTVFALALHQPALQWMCLAGLYVTILSRNGPWQRRLLESLSVITLGQAMLALGTAVGSSSWTELTITPLIVGVCAYAWVWGQRPGFHGRMCAVLFAIGLGLEPHTAFELGRRTGWFALGGLWGLVVTLLAWKLDRRAGSHVAWTAPELSGWHHEARQEFGWKSETFRHAVRAGIIATGATLLSRWLGMERHYWVTITVVSVLVPSRQDSWVRGVQVALATLTAAGIVALAGARAPNPRWLLALAFVAATAAGTVSGVNFGLYLVGVLTAMLLQLELLTHDLRMWKVRIADAGLGVALALLAWGLSELPRLIRFTHPPIPDPHNDPTRPDHDPVG